MYRADKKIWEGMKMDGKIREIVADECHKLKNVLANKQADIERYGCAELWIKQMYNKSNFNTSL